MFNFNMPTSITKSVALFGKASTRHLDAALAKEDAKQANHEQDIVVHAQEQQVRRHTRMAKHNNRMATELKNAESVSEKDQAILDAFFKQD